MSEASINQILTKAAKAPEETGPKPEDMSLESLILLINAERLKNLQTKTETEFDALRARQQNVADLHDVIKAINTATDKNGAIDITNDTNLQNLIENAKNLGVDVKEGQMVFNKDEKDRLIENIRMTVEDLNVQNDMQLQTISRLTNERYESYQLARSILKPLQDAKTTLAKALRGA